MTTTVGTYASNLANRALGIFHHKEKPATDDAAETSGIPRPFDPQQEPAVMLGTDAKSGKITLGNVRWGFLEKGDPSSWKCVFRDTTFDPSKVKEVYAAVRLGQPHALLMFEFEPDSPVTSGTGQKDLGLAISMEARLPVGDHYDQRKGMGKIWGPVYQMGTFSDAIQKACRLRGCELKRYRLNLTQEQKQALLQEAVQEAVKDRTGEYYHTLNNNCITAVFSQLNAVAKTKVAEWMVPGELRNPLTFLPRPMGLVLDVHHLLAKENPVVINEPPGKTGEPVLPWTQNRFVKNLLAPALATTARLTEALVPGGLLTGHLGSVINLLDGRTFSDGIARGSNRHFESSDVYSIPNQTEAELATSVVHHPE